MTTLNEYAALSAYIYNDQRGGGGESSINILGLPADWKKLTELGFTGDTLNTNPFSATAGAYLNQSSGEIVIAYKGTDFLTGREGRSWNTAADLIADVGLGTAVRQLNVPAQLYAASYYAAVKDWAATNGYDDNKISFTGHSLGGGLASNMAVWFNKPATTFAEGPFELSACNRIDMALAIATLTAQAAVSGSAAVLDAINPLRELMLSIPAVFNGDAGNVFNTREAAVTNYYNQGEFLGYLRAVMPTVVGTDIAIDIGNQPLLSLGDSVALHSMNLHAAFLYDDRLRELAKSMPELLPALIDTKLFAADPNSKTRDLITTLVNDQLRQGFAADSALKRFTTDIDKLKGTEGTANTAAWRKALIAVAMDYHYNADAATSKTLFTAESGAIHFNLDDISTTNLKSLPLLRAAASAMGGGDDSNAGTQITNAAAWHVQTGGGAMNWQESTAANDVAVGGAGANVLRAGEGEDFLVGGSDSDTLDGGQGNDVLYGAAGTDTYEFKDSFGKDTVLDSDGQGTLTIDGATLSGGKAAGQRNVWVGKDSAGNFEGYAVYDDRSSATGKKLVITRADGSANSITINNFDLTAATAEGGAGYLGIKLDPTQRIALVQGDGTSVGASTANVWSDRNFNSGNLDSQSTSVQEGNGAGFHIYLAQGAHVGDTITLALTLTGNDLLSGKAGNDTLDGGEGVDILSDDALCGGAGSDRTHSGAGSDLLGKITINSIAACVYSTWAGGIFAYESQGHSSVTLAGGRTHRVSVRSRLRACGRGACGVPAHWHQHRGLHAPAAATENWLRRPGTATRHVCGSARFGSTCSQQSRAGSMRLAGLKGLGRRMDRAQHHFTFDKVSTTCAA